MAELSQYQKYTKMSSSKKLRDCANWGYLSYSTIQNGHRASPSFKVAKKGNTICFLSNFWEVNKRLIRKPFPIPKISMVLQELEGFTFATALDLNMGYYTIRLDPDASKICLIIFPWGKYSYTRLPMGIAGFPTFFKQK